MEIPGWKYKRNSAWQHFFNARTPKQKTAMLNYRTDILFCEGSDIMLATRVSWRPAGSTGSKSLQKVPGRWTTSGRQRGRVGVERQTREARAPKAEASEADYAGGGLGSPVPAAPWTGRQGRQVQAGGGRAALPSCECPLRGYRPPRRSLRITCACGTVQAFDRREKSATCACATPVPAVLAQAGAGKNCNCGRAVSCPPLSTA
jgi:hypothetical protein